MMYQGYIFWIEQLIAYCIAAILWLSLIHI